MKHPVDDILKYRKKLQQNISEEGLSQAKAQLEMQKMFSSFINFSPSEAYGNPMTGDRQEMEKLIRSLLKRKSNSIETIKSFFDSLNSFMNTTNEDISSLDISETVKRIVLLEYMIKLINSFDSTVTGTLLESYFAAVLGGNAKQIGGEREITDIKFGRENLSLKFRTSNLSDSPTTINGSLPNLLKDIGDGKTITYITIWNIPKREKSRAYAGEIYLYYFQLNSENILDFINNINPNNYFKNASLAIKNIEQNKYDYFEQDAFKKRDFAIGPSTIRRFLSEDEIKRGRGRPKTNPKNIVFGKNFGGPYILDASIFLNKVQLFFAETGKNIKYTYDTLSQFTKSLNEYTMIAQTGGATEKKPSGIAKKVTDDATILKDTASNLVTGKTIK